MYKVERINWGILTPISPNNLKLRKSVGKWGKRAVESIPRLEFYRDYFIGNPLNITDSLLVLPMFQETL